MRRHLPWPTLLLAACTIAAGANSPEDADSPEGVVAAFFGPSGIEDKKAWYTGEMLGFEEQPTLGETLPEGVSIATRPLLATDSRAVLGVTLSLDDHAQDWYAYLLQSEGRWKLEAVRTLALTGVSSVVLAELGAKEDLTSEEEWTLQNLRLMLESDAELKDFVRSNTRELERIVALLAHDREAAARAARDLHIAGVEKTDSGLVELVVGGIVDNRVGFLWVPPGMAPPAISASAHIMVEHVVGSWYLFKTT